MPLISPGPQRDVPTEKSLILVKNNAPFIALHWNNGQSVAVEVAAQPLHVSQVTDWKEEEPDDGSMLR